MFLTSEEWTQSPKFDGREPVLRWREVEEKKIFRLTSIQEVIDSKYESYILHCTDESEEQFKIFSPSHFIKQIRKNRSKNNRPFFMSHGTLERGVHVIAQFEIVYKEEKDDFDIFTPNISTVETVEVGQ